jgi:hypothetical protein
MKGLFPWDESIRKNRYGLCSDYLSARVGEISLPGMLCNGVAKRAWGTRTSYFLAETLVKMLDLPMEIGMP